jgi:ubiquinone/menaquinone biosynthesis C-methylase UbiE
MAEHQQYVFNEVASLYDEVRRGYPPAIVDAAVAGARLPPGGRILEVGCGTGKATLPFAARGYEIFALDPGDAMVALAAHNCRHYPKVTFLTTTFEAWRDENETFDMVLSAEAFHWIAPEVGCAKAASVLRPGGAIALIWRLDLSQDTAFYRATQPVYDAYFRPPQGETAAMSLGERAEVCAEAIRRCGAFDPPRKVRQPCERTFRGDEYLKLLHTYSEHRTLPEPDKTHFFRAIEEVIARFGGVVHRRFEILLLLAPRR